jgi:peptidoglycan/LPS O-acetylase OafA/YrhL
MRRLPSLDGVRAGSILLVLLGHELGYGARFAVGDLANLGVRCFFVLSGFLITTLLLNEFRENGRISLRDFYARRTLRIFPAFYVFLLVVFILMKHAWVAPISASSWLHAATYTMDYMSFHVRAWDLGHLWSLAVEEQFYLLWPTVLVLLRPRKALWGAFGVILLVPLVRWCTWKYFPGLIDEMKWQFHTVCDALATGCVLAGVRDALWKRPAYRWLLESGAFVLVPVGIFAVNRAMVGRPRFGNVLGQTMINVGIALCIDYLLRNSKSAAGRVMNLRFVAYLGTLSYSLYLWQQIFLIPDEPGPLAHGFPIDVALALFAAWVSYNVIEKPFLSLRQRFAAPKPSALRSVPATPSAV